MKTNKNIFFLLIAFAISGIAFGQLGTATATYNSGDIETDKYFTYYNGTQSSTCPGLMTVTIPSGATILSTDVSYDMTSDANSAVYRQRSHFRCVSPGGMPEATMTNGPSIYVPGTASYSRTVNIANGVIGGGDINFELHAGVTHYKHYCSTDSAKVDNNTWTITITYIPPGYPELVVNPDPTNGGLYVGLNDDVTWDFGANTENYDVYFGTDNPPTTMVVDFATAGASGSYDPGTMNETETYYWQIVSHNANGYTEGPVWNFTTQCGSFTTPFTEDFETVTLPALPYCWTNKVVSSSTSAKVETSNYYGSNGSKCIGFKNYNDVSATLIFISPLIDLGVGSLADKMVHFNYMGFSYPNLIVGTMSDPNDETTFTPYATMLAYDYLIEKNVYFNNYTGSDTYIAFKMGTTTSYQELYIDEITIDDIPSCIKPEDMYADNMTINSAWLNWTDLNGASSWNIEYGPVGFTPTGTPTASGVSNPHQITGLSSSTEYDFYVQTDCGGSDVSAWTGPGTFLTPCDYFSVPLNENFDASPNFELPVCWTSIVQTADGWTINGIQNYNYNSPSNCYHMQNGWDQNSNLILALPPFTTLLDKTLKFYVYNNSGSYDLEVGTMSNPSDPNTFVLLTNVTTTTSYQEYEVSFDMYTGSDEYIALKHSNGASYLDFYIDDVNVTSGSRISGTITYSNAAMTPLTGCSIDLYDNTDTYIASTTTDGTGYYEFPGLIDGDYTLETTVVKAKGGITTVDGIIIARIAAGIGGPYTPLQFLAADVNTSGVVTTTDGILVKRRAAGLPGEWTAPDYVFESPAVNINTGDETVDYQGVCSGDVNGSFTPPL
ncbi:MAG: carboxypeptidase-like regulatory domain-containing protein [Bacteroidales bacterium]